MTTIDWTKPVQTKTGRNVEIFTTMAKGDYPVVGQIEQREGYGCMIYTWTIDGKYFSEVTDDPLDLVNVPEKQHFYVNVYEDEGKLMPGTICVTREQADLMCHKSRVGCMKVELVAGQWDD